METLTFIHKTALIEEGVIIGDASKIWDHVHIRKGATIGKCTHIGGKSIIATNVVIGNFVKINSQVYIPTAVSIGDGCMIAAGVVFTNDLYPRAMNQALTDLETSDPTEHTLPTQVMQGATIGANATIGPGITLGAYCMVGMGAVVTKDVAPFSLVIGNPAKQVGFVCVCGPKLPNDHKPVCKKCGKKYLLEGNCLRLSDG